MSKSADGEVWFELEGRTFTRHTIQRALIYANKGVITPLLFQEVPVWELLEALEISSDYYSECYNNEL